MKKLSSILGSLTLIALVAMGIVSDVLFVASTQRVTLSPGKILVSVNKGLNEPVS